MIPAKFIFLEKLPLTTSGKIDKGALPKLDFVSRGKFCAPQSKLERELTSLWEEILNLTGIGVEDNFLNWEGIHYWRLKWPINLGGNMTCS